MILAGDVGGTKSNLALFDIQKGIPNYRWSAVTPVGIILSFGHLLEHFLKETQPKLTHACLGVAGPGSRRPVSGHSSTMGDRCS